MNYSNPPANVRVEIPGTFCAEWDPTTGEVVRFVFSPRGSDAGYFGPAAVLDCILDNEQDADEVLVIETEHALELDDVDGPFWAGVQDALRTSTVFANMDDPDDDTTREITSAPIVWEE